MKKIVSLLLVVVMTIGLLSACSKTEEKPADATKTESTENKEQKTQAEQATQDAVKVDETKAVEVDANELEPVTLKMYFEGSNVTDDTVVLEKANEYLQEKLNVTLEPIWGTWGDFDSNVVLAINGGDDVDIYFTCSWTTNEYNIFSQKGAYVRLDDPENNLIEKYGQDIWAILPDVLKTGAAINGSDGYGVYAIPGYKDIAAQYCWDVNVDRLEELGFTLDDVKSRDFYSFGDIFAKAKEVYGDSFYPLLAEGGVLEEMATNAYPVAGDSGDVNTIMEYINPVDPSQPGAYGVKIMNRFTTDEYKKYIKQMHEYYEAGYVDPALSNSEQSSNVRNDHQLTGTYLIGTQSYSLGYEAQASAQRGIHVEYVPTSPCFTNTTSSQGAMMAISTASKNPERAMMFLNLLNTDPYLFTLLDFGVEGIHYNYNDIGEVVFTDKRADYQPWTNGMGNVTQLPPQAGQGADFQEVFKAYYGAAAELPTLGFTFNAEAVDEQIGAVANAAAEYQFALDMGSINPDDVYDEFIAKLEANGINDIVEEVNRQLDEFMAAKNGK